MKHEIHPAAEIFPPMTDNEFAGLVEDIREHGLREAIILYEGKILDGRHRYKACQQLGIEPRFEDWTNGEPPESYVVSKNLHRRHLSESQRAMVAAKMANLKKGQRSNISDPPIGGTQTQKDVAKMLNTSTTGIQRAKTVLKHGTEEDVQAVESGKESVSTMSERVKNRINPKRASNMGVPEGVLPEAYTRQGMALEAEGIPTEDVAKRLGLNAQNYRYMRDIVNLSELDNLLPEESAKVARALEDMNSNRRIGIPYELVKPIVARVWGTRNRDVRTKDKTIVRRQEDFERAFGILIQVCNGAGDIEIPPLNTTRIKSGISELTRALKNVRVLKAKLEDML